MYAPVLRFALDQPWISFSTLVALFLITVPGLIGSGLVKTTFFPFIEGDNLTVNLSMVSGTREEITLAELNAIEAQIWEVNEELKADREDGMDVILAVDKRIGPAAHNGLINVQLLDGERRNLRSTDISAKVREKVGTVYGAENLSFAAFSPFGRPVSVSLLGTDLGALTAATEDLKVAMLQREDLKDVTDNNQQGLRELEVCPSRGPSAWHDPGFASVTGEAGFLRERGAAFATRPRRSARVGALDDEDRSSMSDLKQYRIRTPTAALSRWRLAEVREKRGITASTDCTASGRCR